MLRTSVCALVLAALVSARAGAAAPPAPPPLAIPDASGANKTGACALPVPHTARIAGTVAPLPPGSQPNVVELFPQSDMTTAYLFNMRMSFGPAADRVTYGAEMRDPKFQAWGLYLATHQAQLMAQMRFARPAGFAFSCTGFAPGKYYVIAIVSRTVRAPKQLAAYAPNASNLLMYVSRAEVRGANANAAPLVARTVPFTYLGSAGLR